MKLILAFMFSFAIWGVGYSQTGTFDKIQSTDSGPKNWIDLDNDEYSTNALSIYSLNSLSFSFDYNNNAGNFFEIGTDDIAPGSTNWRSLFMINGEGEVAIGTTDFTGNHKLRVEGSIGAREVIVEADGWSDFVFERNYDLLTLEEVEKHIEENGHLPEVPSESEVTENGINLGQMDAKLLQKIEELTLYMIDMNKRMKELETENLELKGKVQKLENE